MINVEQLRELCLALAPGEVEERFPFAKFNGAREVLVFYVAGHMFCYFDIGNFTSITVKHPSAHIGQLKERHACIHNPYNGNPKHWVGIDPATAKPSLVQELVATSFNLVRQQYGNRKS